LSKYNIEDIIYNNKSGIIKILNEIKIKNRCGYKYKCLICGNEDIIRERNLICGNGCNVCSGKKVLKGYNDLWTTYPEIANLLKNKQIGHQITFGSHKKYIFICKNCGCEKYMQVNNIIRRGLSCINCSDKFPYSEKFMANLLLQLNIKYEHRKTFDWSNNKEYDFYIPNTNCIIETHGEQHYKNIKHWNIKLEEISKNDKYKEQIALSNKIKNYIIIDCKRSEYEYIKSTIIKSKLLKLLNFEDKNINWLKCHEYACDTLVKNTCELWNNKKDTLEISNILKLHRTTIIKYLKQGSILKWCDYDPKKEMVISAKNASEHRRTKIICLTTFELFDSLKDAKIKYNIESSNIVNCCKNKRNFTGKHPETNESLKWMYYEDYIKEQELNKKTNLTD
jgi:hypothetical protein